MMSAVHLKTENNYQAKIKSAEAYEAHGLYNEAMDIYKEILSADSGVEKEILQRVQFKVDELSKEIDDDDKSVPYNLSTEEVSHIKTGLSIGESVPEIIDSATAFKELGLYREAVSEYKKLFLTDIPIGDFFEDFLESTLAVNSAADVIKDIEDTIIENKLNDQTTVSIKFMLGVELDKRNLKEQAVKCYQSVQKIDPMYPKLREKIESIQPDKRFDSRYDFLLRNKIVDTDQLQKALASSKKMKKSVEAVLMEQFKTSKEDIGKSLSSYYNCQFKVFDSKRQVPYELISNLKKPFLIQDVWVPIHWEIDHIEILIDDPKDLSKIDHAKALFNTNKFIFSVGIKEDIIETINFFFSQGKSQSTEARDKDGDDGFDQMPDISFEEVEDEEVTASEEVNEASGKIVQLVDQVLITAFRKNASDIHIEPSTISKKTMIRFRIDGVCQKFLEVPNSFASAVLSRIKIMSNLDISEKRLPQDGKIKFKRRGIPAFELRVATLPTADSQEDVVMRILATSGAMKLADMGLTERNMQVLLKAIAKPYGLVLVVGPTGSGKTTTLHSALNHINTPERKIWTAEDPVEISQLGLRQVEIKNKIGLDFARIMRAFLRADPDVIMVGEMRDHETAAIGIEASLTGHLVFSTLHTNSAPETITRLLDMGLNPLNFSDAFLAVLAQRLLRRLCKNCRKQYTPTQEDFDDIVMAYGEKDFKKLGITYSSDFKLYQTVGCDQCSGTGYKGRLGIHELMEGTPDIKRMIKKQASAEELFIKANEEGMTTLMQDGIMKVLSGHTDMVEVRRVCIS